MKELQEDKEFQTSVLENAKPVLVDFFATWCGPCRNMSPIVDSVAEELKDTIDACKVNVDILSDTAAEFRISSIPTFMIFKQGQSVARRVGSMSREDLKNWIQENA
jgi:thioredoxin 1